LKRIQRTATLLIAPVALFLFVYPYKAMLWNLNTSFLEPSRWLKDSWVHPEAVIEPATRAVFFTVWLLPLLAGGCSVLFALRLLWLLRGGILFDTRVAAGILGMGGSIVASNSLHLIAAAVSPMIKSWHNPDGPLPLRFWYSSSHLGLLFAGLAFLLMGWVMTEAIRLARENEEFI
jgi:hypothetical protein